LLAAQGDGLGRAEYRGIESDVVCTRRGIGLTNGPAQAAGDGVIQRVNDREGAEQLPVFQPLKEFAPLKEPDLAAAHLLGGTEPGEHLAERDERSEWHDGGPWNVERGCLRRVGLKPARKAGDAQPLNKVIRWGKSVITDFPHSDTGVWSKTSGADFNFFEKNFLVLKMGLIVKMGRLFGELGARAPC